MMRLLFEAVIQCIFVTLVLQIRFLSSINLVKGMISLHLETGGKSCIVSHICTVEVLRTGMERD